jgi:hypothetical protein
MGSFINSQSDNEICEVLNKRFSDDIVPNDGRTYIAELRDFCSIENLFDGNHNLHRVFYRLAHSITGGPSVPKHNQSRFRWYHFLGSNLCPPNTKAAINTVLSNVLAQNSNIEYATFLTRHVATASQTFELYPGNTGAVQTYTDANGKKYCKVVLDCHDDKKLPDSNNEPDPPPGQPGEHNLPHHFAAAARRGSRTGKKSSAKKSSAKKSSAKKKTKTAAGKKSPAKKSKKAKSRR